MILAWRVVFVAVISLLIWMHHWAGRYVSLSDARAYQQYRVLAEFDPVAEPSPGIWSGNKSEYFKQVAQHQRVAAADARFAIKELGPQLRQARYMLIDVSGWAIATLALITAGTLLVSFRSRRALRR